MEDQKRFTCLVNLTTLLNVEMIKDPLQEDKKVATATLLRWPANRGLMYSEKNVGNRLTGSRFIE